MRRSSRTVSALITIVLAGGLAAKAVTAAPQEKVIKVNGINIHYVEQGQGEPVVFIHGAIADWRAWEAQRDAVAQRYRFIAYARRYYGKEPWPDDGKNFSSGTDAADLVAFIKALKQGPVHVVTWSAGWRPATLAALDHPEVFRSITHYEPGALTGASEDVKAAQQERDNGRAAARKLADADPVEGMKRLVEATFRSPRGSFDALPSDVQASFLTNARTLTLADAKPRSITCEHISTISLSTLIITGEKTDRFYPLAADKMAGCMTRAKRLTLKGATHGGPAQNADTFNRELLAFLGSAKSQTPTAAASPVEKVLAVNGVNIHYIAQGQGEPVVFVHGNPGDYRAWEMQREAIAQRYQFIAYTRRYYGREPWADDGKSFSPATDAADLVGFIKALNRGPVHVVAWSGGGPSVMRAVLEHSELFRSLFVYESQMGMSFPNDPEVTAALKEVTDLRARAGSTAALQRGDVVTGAKLAIEVAFQMPTGSFPQLSPDFQDMVLASARTMTLIAAPAPPVTCDMLGRVKLPTQLVTGSNTFTVYPVFAKRISACMGNAPYKVIDGIAHSAPVFNADVFNRALLDFLAAVKAKQTQASN